MAARDTLILGGTIVTMDASRSIILDGAVAVSGARIAEVGKREALASRYPDAERVDARGMLVIPGLIDGHNHPAHYLTKGLLDDIATPRRWATRLYPFDVSVDAEQSYCGSMGTFAELIRGARTLVAGPGNVPT